MIASQKLEMRLSEIRQRMNALAVQETLTEAEQAEVDSLSAECQAKETQKRAALVAEQTDAKPSEDGEGREIRHLQDKVSVTRYMEHAVERTHVDGAEAELNAAVRAGNNVLPWEALEVRADVVTDTSALDGGTAQRSILGRLFGRSVLADMGVRLDNVPSGMSEYVLLTGGVEAEPRAESGTVESVAATFATRSLKPKGLSGRYVYTREQAAQVSGIEAALRRDLAAAIQSKMSDQIINGTGTDPEVTGLLTRLTAPAASTAASPQGGLLEKLALSVDGLHAQELSDLTILMGVVSFQSASSVVPSGAINATDIELARSRGVTVKATTYIAAPATVDSVQNVQESIVHRGRDAARGDSIAAMWGAGPTLIVDPYTNAASAQVALTWHLYWDAYPAFRQDAYTRPRFKMGTA